MRCPGCGAALEERAEGLFEDILVHVCARCDGTFCPAGALDRLDDAVTVDVEALGYEPVGTSSHPCPACTTEGYRGATGATLERVRSEIDPTLELLRCAGCAGFWLAEGQLDQLRELAAHVSAEENEAMNRRATTLEEARRKKARR